MSIAVMSWVWKHSASKGADRLVLLAIADSANDSGREAYPAMSTIAAKANTDKRTAQRSIRHLVETGELAVVENGGPKGCHRYRVLMTEGRGDATPASHHPDETPPGDMPPRQDTTVASDPAGGGISSQKGRGDATRTVHEPPKNRPATSNEPKKLSSTNDARFVEFWNAYPKRVAKGDALKALAKVLARGVPIEDVVKGAARYRDDPARDPDYTAHPATWLNAERWADESTERRSPRKRTPGDFSHLQATRDF